MSVTLGKQEAQGPGHSAYHVPMLKLEKHGKDLADSKYLTVKLPRVH